MAVELQADVEALLPDVEADLTEYGFAPGLSTLTMRSARAALLECWHYAPEAPPEILVEAATRLAAWIVGTRPHVSQEAISDPSGTSVTRNFTNGAATANGLRASGASAALARFRRRRGGTIPGTAS